jgi:hypothetical protein
MLSSCSVSSRQRDCPERASPRLATLVAVGEAVEQGRLVVSKQANVLKRKVKLRRDRLEGTAVHRTWLAAGRAGDDGVHRVSHCHWHQRVIAENDSPSVGSAAWQAEAFIAAWYGRNEGDGKGRTKTGVHESPRCCCRAMMRSGCNCPEGVGWRRVWAGAYDTGDCR